MDIREKISTDLGIPQKFIQEALAVSRIHVKKFRIAKRNGGSREIFHPAKKLKTIQYWLIANLFSKLPIHESSAAYIKGKSILSNAIRHRNNQYFLKMDFKNFFPSIKWRDLEPIISTWHERTNPGWELTNDAKNLVRQSCFYKHDCLPIGYPSSPVVSNIVMYDVDKKIQSILADRDKYGNAIYTRYADDLVISTDKRNICKEIHDAIVRLVRNTDSPKLWLNPEKTKMGSSTSGSAFVTGLRICSEGHITIHRKQKDHIRLLLALYKKKKLNQAEEASLLGHLSYIRHVAPQFYSRLQHKYFGEIENLRLVRSDLDLSP